ncbi:MAG: hypothetical protein MN733_01400 [Nitrososphaera sp.]|nr:hypothetical protein [Nitrososphaera sp.]
MMPTDIQIDAKGYVSSKRASQVTGYTQDYIGQLARGAHIEARRVGGLWYVSLESLTAYKNKSDEFSPTAPVHTNSVAEADAIVTFAGKEYISANRASKISGYNQDYVGQLARVGKIMSRQVGNRWYVDKDALLAHRQEKDSLLGAVQAQSVGLESRNIETTSQEIPHQRHDPLLTYTRDSGDLLPDIGVDHHDISTHTSSVPIRVLRTDHEIPVPREAVQTSKSQRQNTAVRIPVQTIHRAVIPALALTIVVALSVGMISLRDQARYTVISNHAPSFATFQVRLLVANAVDASDHLLDLIEAVLTKDLKYQRGN